MDRRTNREYEIQSAAGGAPENYFSPGEREVLFAGKSTISDRRSPSARSIAPATSAEGGKMSRENLIARGYFILTSVHQFTILRINDRITTRVIKRNAEGLKIFTVTRSISIEFFTFAFSNGLSGLRAFKIFATHYERRIKLIFTISSIATPKKIYSCS